LKKFLALLFIAFLLSIAYWVDTDSMPEVLKALYRFLNGDRVGHFVLYGLLAFLLNWAFPKRGWFIQRRWWIPLGSLVALAGATLEEILQLFFANRTANLVDLGCGLLGILCATLLTNRRLEKS
jgi:VanZ family protein